MRRFDKKKHIQELNKKMSNHTITRVIETFPETLKEEDEVVESTTKAVNLLSEGTTTMFDKLCGVRLVTEAEDSLTELSSDRVLGAANKMWQSQNGGDQFENPRAKKLLQTYAEKLHGMKLFGGEIDSTAVDLVRNNKDNKGEHAVGQLVVFINSTNGNPNAHQGGGIFYNYSTDQFMNGHSFSHGMVPYDTPVSKFDARQLSKIAAHFNPKTRYAHYERELNIQVEQAVEGEITEAPLQDNDTYFETLSATLDKVREKAEAMGYTLDEDAVHWKFGTGGIPYGETKSATIDLFKDGKPIVGRSGKPLNRALRVVIYRMDSGRYELVCYKTW